MTLMRTRASKPESSALTISSMAAEPAVCLPERRGDGAGGGLVVAARAS